MLKEDSYLLKALEMSGVEPTVKKRSRYLPSVFDRAETAHK